MRRAAAAVALAACAAAAPGAPPAPPRVNGAATTAAQPLRLAKDDRLDAGDAPVRVATAAGELLASPRAVVVFQGAEAGIEYWFVASGTVEGDVGPKATLGAAPSWASAPRGAASARVRIDATTTGADSAAAYRAVAGSVWLTFHAVATWLPQGAEVRLRPAAEGPGSLGFAAPSSNRDDLEVTRTSGDVVHAAIVAPGVSGFLADRGGATRIGCTEAPSDRILRAEARRGGRDVAGASVGPLVEAVLDGAKVEVEVPSLGRGAVRSLLGLAPGSGPAPTVPGSGRK